MGPQEENSIISHVLLYFSNVSFQFSIGQVFPLAICTNCSLRLVHLKIYVAHQIASHGLRDSLLIDN